MPFFRLTHCNHYVATLLSTGFSYPITSPYFLCKYFVCRREFPPDGNIGGRRKLLPPQDLNNRAINIYMAFLYHKQKACQVFFCIFVGEGLVPCRAGLRAGTRPAPTTTELRETTRVSRTIVRIREAKKGLPCNGRGSMNPQYL